MASPNFNELHARLSRQVEDPVAAASAATDGGILSSAVRSDYLNRATREFLQNAYLILGVAKMRKLFQTVLTTQAIGTFDSAGTTLTNYIELPIDLVKTGDTSKFVYWPNKSELDNYENPHVNNAYAIEGGKLYAYQDGTVLSSGAGTFYHISYIDLVADDSSNDTLIPSIFYDTVVDYAVSYYLAETGKTDELRATRIQNTLKSLAQMT